MSALVITVQGRHTAHRPAEVGILTLAIEAEGSEPRPVLDEAAGAVASVRALLADAGESLRTSSTDEIRTWNERPWTDAGRRADPVFHARAETVAEFVDVDRLGRVVADATEVAGVTVQAVRWELTDESQAEAADEARWGAVADATTKAVTYAAALGFDSPTPTAIADAGMLDGGVSSAPSVLATARMTTDAAGVELRPRQIEIEATVDIRFAAG